MTGSVTVPSTRSVPMPLAHEAGLPDQVHDIVGHLEGDPKPCP
jgi:hypothetical protein